MADGQSQNQFFIPKVTPPDQRPYEAVALRKQGIGAKGWLMAIARLEALQRLYDESEGQDHETEGELSDQLSQVWDMVTAATSGQEPPPRLASGKNVDFGVEKNVLLDPETNLPQWQDAGPRQEPPPRPEPPQRLQ